MTAAVPGAGALVGADRPLAELYDVALLDLDGVVYLGSAPVTGAAAALAAAVKLGIRLGYVTNNASRSPEAVAGVLAGLGVPAEPAQVVTSAQTAARVLAAALPPQSRVLIVGTSALAEQVRACGLLPVRDLGEPVAAVVQGFSPDTGWRELAMATRAVRGGATWIATNADLTVPSVHGPLPGNGAFVSVVAASSGARPQVTGKPEPSMHAECVERLAASRPIVVGDRLDTDIEGAGRVGCPSLLVFTGVTRPVDLLAAPPQHRPTYLSADLSGLVSGHPEVVAGTGGWRCGGWQVTTSGWLSLTSTPADAQGAVADPWSALRALCTAAWARGDVDLRPGDAAAELAFGALGMGSPSEHLPQPQQIHQAGIDLHSAAGPGRPEAE